MQGARIDQQTYKEVVGLDDEEVDPKMALMSEPIVGIEKVVYDDATGSGAIPARPLTSPKSMSAAQRAVHDITHMPYHPGCEICVSCRRPNTQHRSLKSSERTVPLMVGDYAFPKHSEDSEPMTVLVIRVFPYKLFLVVSVPCKGRDPHVVQRLARFIKECGLLHFTYRSDREPAIIAMIEEACAIAGRKGLKDGATTDAEAIDQMGLMDGSGNLVTADITVDDAVHEPSSLLVESAHTAAPELTHPGESQSNGLAERSVGIVDDQFRTLKHALELHLKHRLPVSHPATSWLVEHTAWVLNKFHMGSDGRTAYGRLHGREGHERVCEFGERIMWYVPKKLRSKLDQRWRYGVFLGRSLSSDQNYVALSNGDVVCARAIVRVVPNIRWSAELVSKVNTTPLQFKTGTLDKIEETTKPHMHPDPEAEASDAARQARRLRILDADVRKYGYTKSCQRCEYLRQGRTLLARGARHNEECRDHTYEAMRKDGVDKVKRAELDDPSRNASRAKRQVDGADQAEAMPNLNDAPQVPLPSMDDVVATDTPNDEPTNVEVDDTYNFHEEVDADLGADIDVDWAGGDLHDPSNDHMMASLVDVLQSVGVPVGDAVSYAVTVVKDRVPISVVSTEHSYNATFFEVYGQGSIMKASHGCRRNLNVNGLNALDLRTFQKRPIGNLPSRSLRNKGRHGLWEAHPVPFSARGIKVSTIGEWIPLESRY